MSPGTTATGEHLLDETLGLFGKTIYECRHCGVRSPDDEYFSDISCPPTVDEESS